MFDNQSGQKIYDSCEIFSMWWFAIKIATFFHPALLNTINLAYIFFKG